MKVFLLDDGEFTSLIRALRSLDEEVRIVGFVSSPFAAHTAMLDACYVAPDWREEGYYRFLAGVIRREKVQYVFPIHTPALSYMARIAFDLRRDTGAFVITSPYESILCANDKGKLFGRFRDSSISSFVTPYTVASTCGELYAAARSFLDRGIDCISKPVVGENAEGYFRFADRETWRKKALEGTADKLFCTDVLADADPQERLPEDRLVMPYLPGTEWDVDVLAMAGQILAITIRKNRSMMGGLSACSVTAENQALMECCRVIVRTLNLSYLSCLSFKEDENGQPKLLEINPRTMGSVFLSTFAGNDLIRTLVTKLLPRAEADGCPAEGAPCLPAAGLAEADFPAREFLQPKSTRPGVTVSLYYDQMCPAPERVRTLPEADACETGAVRWNNITPPDYALYKHYYDQTDSRITDIVFNCRFAWDILYHFQWAVIEDCLVQISFGSENSSPFLMVPLGTYDVPKLERILRAVLPEFTSRGLPAVIYGIDRSQVELFEQIGIPHQPAVYDEDYSDYLYDGDALRTLAGRVYAKKRNHLHNFEKLYPGYTYESLSPAHFDACLALVRQWEAEKEVDPTDPTQSDASMIANLLGHWHLLKARGGVIKVDGKVIAFSIGSMEKDTAFIHFEKADNSYNGVSAAINQLVLQQEFPEARFVNREEDLGIPGLRKAKESYYPIDKVRKYKMRLQP